MEDTVLKRVEKPKHLYSLSKKKTILGVAIIWFPMYD